LYRIYKWTVEYKCVVVCSKLVNFTSAILLVLGGHEFIICTEQNGRQNQLM